MLPLGTLPGSVIVTGGARGIGAATGSWLVEHGVNVLLMDVDPDVERVAHELGHHRCRASVGDVALSDDCAKTVAIALEAFSQPVSGLVNSAAVLVRGDALTTSESQWDHQLGVNLKGAWLMTRALLPTMIELGGGSIVNVVSIEGNHSGPNNMSYAVSKAGLLQFTRSVARDFGPRGIRCNAVSPGSVDTPMMEAHINGAEDPRAFRAAIEGKNPLGRLGHPLEIARLIAVLLAEVDGFVNGADLVIDGGRSVAV